MALGKKDEVIGTCSTHRGKGYAYIVLKGHFEDADVTGKIRVYEKGSKKQSGEGWTGFIWLRIETSSGLWGAQR
jgi:hypothetical protein